MARPAPAIKASDRPSFNKRASFGGEAGLHDATGVSRKKLPDENFVEGHQYWIADRLKVWKKVTIVAILEDGTDNSSASSLAVCVDGVGAETRHPVNSLLPPSPVNPEVVDDITSLHYIHEAAILSNLEERSKLEPKPKPYTYMCNVLVAVNPLRRDLAFKSSADYSAASAASLFLLPPHPFGMAENALRQMQATPPLGMDQAIVISGESGAGKTETFKIILNHLLAGNSSDDSGSLPGNAPGTNSNKLELDSSNVLLERRLVESSPLLEAFGNARTSRNHNSSRFGKFLKLLYVGERRVVKSKKPDATAAMTAATTTTVQYSLKSARIETYLLEKTRVVSSAVSSSLEEGNFHVLYALLAACRDKTANRPEMVADFRLNDASSSDDVLNKGGRLQQSSLEDVTANPNHPNHVRYLPGASTWLSKEGAFEVPPRLMFDQTCDALTQVVGVSKEQVADVWRVLAGVLHLGGVEFEADDAAHEDGTKVSGANAKRSLHACSHLWGLTPQALLTLLTQKTIQAGGGGGGVGTNGGAVKSAALVKPLNPVQATAARDNVAKLVYSLLFEWVTHQTNRVLTATASSRDDVGNGEDHDEEKNDDDGDEGAQGGKRGGRGKQAKVYRSLGLLDLFGFESFLKNDFEQLLINLANEALQDMYCKQVLIAESKLYKAEGLRLDNAHSDSDLAFLPNSECVKLLMRGLVPILDEHTQLATGSDKTMLRDVNAKLLKASPHLLVPHARVRHECFCVRHYAEDVLYTVGNFTAKNDNALPKDVSHALRKSQTNPLLKALMEQQQQQQQPAGASSSPDYSSDGGGYSSGGGGSGIESGGEGSEGARRQQKKARSKKSPSNQTVAGEFARSMEALTAELSRSQCSYVRCVKPNASMKAGVFDPQYVVTQLRCLGLLQTCEVLKVGLPTRVPYSVLREQLSACLPPQVVATYEHRSDKELVMAALEVFDVPRDAYHLGYTRLFFHTGRYNELDKVLRWKEQDQEQAPSVLLQEGEEAAEESGEMSVVARVALRFQHHKMRKIWRTMYCRLQVALMWISMLREFRERRARAIDLFGRAIHRKKTMKDWAALVIAAGEKQVQERAENAAASLISLHFFAFCCQKSVLFKRRHPSGPRVKGDERAHKAREEREFKLKELSEEEAKAAHEAFITQAARLRLVGNDAELKLLREREVLKMTPEDMSIRVASLLAHARKYQHKPNAKASGGGGGGRITSPPPPPPAFYHVLDDDKEIENERKNREAVASLAARIAGRKSRYDHQSLSNNCQSPTAAAAAVPSAAAAYNDGVDESDDDDYGDEGDEGGFDEEGEFFTFGGGGGGGEEKQQSALPTSRSARERSNRLLPRQQQNQQQNQQQHGSGGVGSGVESGPYAKFLAESAEQAFDAGSRGGTGRQRHPEVELGPPTGFGSDAFWEQQTQPQPSKQAATKEANPFLPRRGVGWGYRYTPHGEEPSSAQPLRVEPLSPAVTPEALAESRVSSAVAASVAALDHVSKQLEKISPEVAAQAEVGRLTGWGSRPFTSKKSMRIVDAAQELSHQNSKMQECGRLLFDAELILHNLLDLEKWHKGRAQVTSNRSFGYRNPSTFASHNLSQKDLLGAYGKLPHRLMHHGAHRRQVGGLGQGRRQAGDDRRGGRRSSSSSSSRRRQQKASLQGAVGTSSGGDGSRSTSSRISGPTLDAYVGGGGGEASSLNRQPPTSTNTSANAKMTMMGGGGSAVGRAASRAASRATPSPSDRAFLGLGLTMNKATAKTSVRAM